MDWFALYFDLNIWLWTRKVIWTYEKKAQGLKGVRLTMSGLLIILQHRLTATSILIMSLKTSSHSVSRQANETTKH